jgi:hypothetical protein
MPQTSYPLDLVPAIVGQVVERGTMSGRYECSEDIPFGRVVELHTDGKWRLPQGTTIGKVLAVAHYNPSYSSDGYKAGDQVAFLRSGKVWIANDGGGAPGPATGKMNVRHASTDANSEAQHRGKLTLTATSATAGSEISACNGTEFIKEDTAPTMALCHINFPANSGG